MQKLLMAAACLCALLMGVLPANAATTVSVFVYEPVGGDFGGNTYRAWMNCGYHGTCDHIAQAGENQNATDWQWPSQVTHDTFIRLRAFDPTSATDIPVADMRSQEYDSICNGALVNFYPLGSNTRIGAVAYFHIDWNSINRQVLGNSGGRTNSSKVGVMRYPDPRGCSMSGYHAHTYFVNSTLSFDAYKNPNMQYEQDCSSTPCNTFDLFHGWHWHFSFLRGTQ